MAITREQAQQAKDDALKDPEPPPNTDFDASVLCLSPAEWEARDLPPEDKLLGPFSTTARAELSADTGLGKTMLGLALAHAMARGVPFLHWHPGRAGRVLYIDGEMPGELIQARLGAARSWFGLSEPLGRDRLCVLSKADVEDQMPPLDSPEGERWLLGFCEQVGRFDHITFDNRACLTIGDLFGDDASTQTVKSLQRELTKQKIGQLWLHHTGYETSRGYGRKSREWELDSVAVGEWLQEQNDADVAMRITFKKARRRTPDNRADYEPVEVTLQRGEWLWSPADTEARSVKTTLGRNNRSSSMPQPSCWQGARQRHQQGIRPTAQQWSAEDFDAALRLDQNYAQAYFNRGVAYDLKGEHDQAIEDFDAALRLDPNDAMTYIARGFAYERKGQYDQARRDFEKALTLDPGLERARTDRAALEDELAEPLPSEPPQRAPTATMPDGKRVAHPRPDRGQPAARLQPGLRRVSARRLRAGVHPVRGHRGRAHRGRRQEWRAAPVPAQGRTRTDQAHPGAGQLRALSPMPLPAARCARAAGP
jgi:Tfp pilus assembly protein PilF